MRSLLLCCLIIAGTAVEVSARHVRVIDGDTIETDVGRVRLLYIDTPESKSNKHGVAMPEGQAATAYLSKLLASDAPLTLWGPGEQLAKDRYGRVLCVVWLRANSGALAQDQLAEMPSDKININLTLIQVGWSPYWRKYGPAPEAEHLLYTQAQDAAKVKQLGAWSSAPTYMNDKSQETTAPTR